jgi:predicted aspartyl protease
MRHIRITATLTSERTSKQYEFIVITGSTYMGLPEEEIEALGLYKIPGGRVQVRTATGIVDYDSYSASVSIEGNSAPSIVLPAPIPLTGYEVLENLRMKVNPVSRKLEPVPDDEPHPPYQL